MFPCYSRATARHKAATRVALVVVVAVAWPASAEASGPDDAAALTLAAVEALALDQAPQLDATRAQAQAARERAISARQLPDPRLTAGVSNLPVNGEDRFSLSRDFMTMTGVGVMQEFPRASKRRLRGQAEALAAQIAEARRVVLEHAIRRDAALAYLDLWRPQQAARLVEAMVEEARRERSVVEIAFRAGRVPQADLLAAEVELELLHDRHARLSQDADEARERLARWTGTPVSTPLTSAEPALPSPPALPELLALVEHHPEMQVAETDIATRDNALALAREAYKPDWRAELMLAWRPDFSEMATLQLGMDLPVFTRNRQDRDVAAAAADAASVHAMHEDHARRLRADAAAAWRAWSRARQRLRRYDEVIVPAAAARAEAALAAYRAGRSELAAVLDARRAALDVSLMRLDLQVESLRRLAELRYLSA
ncbi:MAG: TolC family protein [Pseudomonadota bacterium]